MRILQTGKRLAANNSRGFTLIELVVVLVIVGLIASLAAPRLFNSIGRVELKDAARRTLVLLNKARKMAYYQRVDTFVRFDLEGNTITVFEKRPLETGQLKKVDSLAYVLPGDLSLEVLDIEGGKETFDLFFSSAVSSGGTILLRDKGGRYFKIKVDVVTGYARIMQ